MKFWRMRWPADARSDVNGCGDKPSASSSTESSGESLLLLAAILEEQRKTNALLEAYLQPDEDPDEPAYLDGTPIG